MRKLLFRITLAVSLAACALSIPGGPLGPKAALAASPALDAAQQLYDGAKFTDAVAKLRDAISSGAVTGPEALKAKELLGRCLVKAGSRIEAKQQFKNLLRQDSGYRLDATVVPPDEMEVFELASKEILAEQIEAGQRIPASLSFYWGDGAGDNENLGEFQQHFGGANRKLDKKSEFGGSVRFPLRPRFSLDIELSRLRATGKAPGTPGNIYDFKFEAAAIPLVVSLYWTVLPGDKFRANVFVGGGKLMAASSSMDMGYFTYDPPIRFVITDTKTGSYLHGGAEAEYAMLSKLSLAGRVLYRSATASKLYGESGLMRVIDNTAPSLNNRKVDFSGVAYSLGLRAYIGY